MGLHQEGTQERQCYEQLPEEAPRVRDDHSCRPRRRRSLRPLHRTSSMSNETVIGMPEIEYHAAPGLSSTGMKWLLRSPKHYRQNMDHRVEKAVFDLGHAVHAKVLGVGLGVTVIPTDLLASNGAASTKAAKDWIALVRAKGEVPIKAEVFAKVDAIAEAVLSNPKAHTLLSLDGDTEVSLFADDPETGVHMRGRIDNLGTFPDGRLVYRS